MWITNTASAQTYRCGNTYSDEPCKGGKAIDTSPAMSDPRGAKTTVIYLCSATQGARYWTHEQCSKRGWTIERTERVPANVPWDEQVAAARAQQREAREVSRPAPTYYQAPNVNVKVHECARLEAHVKYLDDEGRRGGGHNKMEWLREERRNTRNAQFQLKC